MVMIQKNIESSMKINNNDLINPIEMGVKSSLFFRLHVSGLIESANVYINNKNSFMMAMLFFVNMI